MKKKNTLSLTVNTNPKTKKFFAEKIQERIVEKYADVVVGILEDKTRLEKALASVNKVIEEVEKGNYEIIKKYVRARNKLEFVEDGELEL